MSYYLTQRDFFPLSRHPFGLLDRLFDDVDYSTAHRFSLDESDDAYTLSLDLPGFKSGDVDVNLDKGLLTVSAKRDARSYQQSVTLPRGVDVDKIEARLEDGVLSISLPKSQLAKPRKIAIR